jgi:hypothetical protein
MGPRSYAGWTNADCAALTIELFVSYLALNLLSDVWRHSLHAVFFSGVLVTDKVASRMILMAHICQMQTFLCRVHNPRAAKKERLPGWSVSTNHRKGSSRADGFVLAIFPWLLKGAAARGEHRQAAGSVTPKQLMQAALIRLMSAIKHSEGLLFGVASSLQHSVWNIAGQNFLVSFSLARRAIKHSEGLLFGVASSLQQ